MCMGRRLWGLVLAVGLLLCFVVPAAAGPLTYNFTYSDPSGTSGKGTLSVVDSGLGDGSLHAVSGTLTLTGTANGNASLGTYPLIPGGPGVDNSGGFIYDNLIYPLNNAGTGVNGGGTIDPSYLDFPGLLFGTLLRRKSSTSMPLARPPATTPFTNGPPVAGM